MQIFKYVGFKCFKLFNEEIKLLITENYELRIQPVLFWFQAGQYSSPG